MREHFIFRQSVALLSVLFLQYFLIGCTAKGPAIEGSIKLGVTLPLTGTSAESGKHLLRGIELAVIRINQNGGISGKPVELIHKDDAQDPGKTLAAYRSLINESRVLALVGLWGSQNVGALLPFLEKDGVPLIGPVVGMNFSNPIRKNVFAIRSPLQADIRFLLDAAIHHRKVKRIAIFYEDDLPGKNGLALVEAALAERQIKAVGRAPIRPQSVDVAKAAQHLASLKPDLVVNYAAMPAKAALARSLAEAGVRPLYIGPRNQETPEFHQFMAAKNLEYFAASVFPPFTSDNIQIVRMYKDDMKKAGYPELNAFGIEGYFNTLVLGEALRLAGSKLSRDSLRRALESIDSEMFGIRIHLKDHQGIDKPFLVKSTATGYVLVSSMARP